jgi:hypothetical protein
MRPMLGRRTIRIVIPVSSNRASATQRPWEGIEMANITNELNSLVNVVHDWFVQPQVQQQYGGNVNQYLEDHGYDTAAPGFAQDFHDAAQIAVQPHVNFEATNTAIDNQAGSPVTNIGSPSALAGSAAPLLSGPALAATQSAAIPPAPVPQASYATPAEAQQAVQAITEHYNTYYNTYATTNTEVDNRQTLVDTSTNTTINADHSDVDFENNAVTNTVSGDGSFGANVEDGDIEGVALGERSVAAGDDVNGAATGDGAVAAGDDAIGATGERSIAGEEIGAANSGTFTGLQVGDDIEDSEVQTITGTVNGVAANDSDLDGVNTGDATHGGVINNDIDGDANTNTGDLNRSAQNFGDGDQNAITGDNRGIQNQDGDQNAFQGDGNVGNALGEDATSTIDHSSVATNGSESGNVFDIDDSSGIGFGSGDVISDSEGVATRGGQAANVDSSAFVDDDSHGDAEGGPVNINFDGNQAVASDNSAASTDGDATAQNVFDSENVNQIGDDGDATVQDISHSDNVAATGQDGDSFVDDSFVEDNSLNDSLNAQDSFNPSQEIDQEFDQNVDVEDADDVDVDAF